MAKKQNFMQSAAVLAAGVALVKIIGAVFKIPLANLITEEAFAHFNVAYTVYNVLLVISTAGLPVAVSKMVAEANETGRYDETKRTIRAALSTFTLIGLVGSVLMFVFAAQIADLMKSPDSVWTIRVIAPASFFVAVMSVWRGYYQGVFNMFPTAISQVVEALSKLVFGLLFAYLLIRAGYPQEVAAAGAIGGVTVGTILGAVYLVLCRVFDRNRTTGGGECRSQREITKRLLAIAIPITIGAGVLALTNFIDSTLVMRRLQTAAGFEYERALFLYGSYSYAQTLFNFPSAFIVPFAASLVPAVAAALAKNDKKGASSTVESAMRITSLLALPAAAGLSVLSGPILELIFSGKEGAAAAALPLTILAVAVFFNCVVMLSNATLQSMGKVRVPVYTMLAGSVVKIVSNWFLVANPDININGAPIGTCLCYLTIMVLNLAVISREIRPAPRVVRTFIKPLLASAVMAAAAWAANGLFVPMVGAKLAVLGAIAAAGIVYLVLAVLMGAIRRSDLEMLPKGVKIADILRLK